MILCGLMMSCNGTLISLMRLIITDFFEAFYSFEIGYNLKNGTLRSRMRTIITDFLYLFFYRLCKLFF